VSLKVPEEAEIKTKTQLSQIWQDKLIDKLAHRIEDLLKDSAVSFATESDAENNEENQQKHRKPVKQKISFDDLGGILEMLSKEKE
jgi:maltodextrin utilization protein YvdJ